jgi:hypothetical protein
MMMMMMMMCSQAAHPMTAQDPSHTPIRCENVLSQCEPVDIS